MRHLICFGVESDAQKSYCIAVRLFHQQPQNHLNAERAIPHLQVREALSWGWGMLVSDGDEKPHLINCEAICVHEEEAKRIPNVRFTL